MISIVLAEPEIPANIGFVARHMACHGLRDLRIVGRSGMALHPDAIRTSSGEEAILEATRDFPDMDAALSDCTFALGFSRRVRDPGQRILALPEAAVRFSPHAPGNAPDRMALVFGCESQGLSREQALRCSHLVRIPLPGPLLSLNLSHAAAIALYAFFGGAPGNEGMGKEELEKSRERAGRSIPGKHREDVQRGLSASPRDLPAASPQSVDPLDEALPLAEGERILSAVIARMVERGQFRAVKAEAQAEYLRILWQRLQPTRREAEFLAGILKKLGS